MDRITNNQCVNYSGNVSPQFKAQDVSAAPVGYMPDAQVRSAANGMVGMMALGAIGVAGIALAAISRGKVKNLKADCVKLKQEKDILKKELEEALNNKKPVEKIKKDGKKIGEWFKNLGQKIKNIFKRGEKPSEPPKN